MMLSHESDSVMWRKHTSSTSSTHVSGHNPDMRQEAIPGSERLHDMRSKHFSTNSLHFNTILAGDRC